VDQESFYLDYNATSPLSQSVLNWLKSGDVFFGNPSSQHSFGKYARKVINESRADIIKSFQFHKKDPRLFFHSGATEAMITFAYSFSEWARLSGRELLICFSKLDHPAVTSLADHFFGPHVKMLELKIDQSLGYDFNFNLKNIKDKKENNPDLIILYHHLWVHNETGIVSPLNSLEILKEIPDLFIHIDAVQSPGKISDWRELKVGDIFSFSAHKFGALKGLGFSLLSNEVTFFPLITGGGQQNGFRSGTENALGVKSISLALKDLDAINIDHILEVRNRLEILLVKELKGIGGVISQIGKFRNSNTIYFYFDSLSSDIALAFFDLNGLMISSGSACSSGAAKDSAIMKHLGFKKEAKNGLRLSLPFTLNKNEADIIEQKLSEILIKLKGSQYII
jgi:cysteine desulfurase